MTTSLPFTTTSLPVKNIALSFQREAPHPFESLSEEELSRLGLAIQKVHKAASIVFKTSSYLLLQKNGKEVGQSVPHIHIHYIPRKLGDRFQLIFFFKILLTHLFPQLSNHEMETCKALMEKEIH